MKRKASLRSCSTAPKSSLQAAPKALRYLHEPVAVEALSVIVVDTVGVSGETAQVSFESSFEVRFVAAFDRIIVHIRSIVKYVLLC